ncbi:MBL fold metallo-hydrolase [Euzebya rosea]|uniref:MBL fold metallo-hydrolase n=1 Tax=Euzebya rosea TaxID=2052804 RepID=UPI000D3EACA7|nr:MBL fold metallo-hydrolase [Euzebya rosea]
MQLEQLHHESLGHASYLIASEQTGDAIVVDPRRDVSAYLDLAAREGYRIRYVVDTHQHNDYLSGLHELVERSGATALGSGHTDHLGYDHEPVKDGHQLEMGEVGITVLHTPGHTPEHISFLLTDGQLDDDEPAMLLSGGALLVGDLARPDLLGTEEQTKASAESFCHTIQKKLLTLPDHVLVYPTHVAGSLCGGDIGSRLVTTVGYERRTNAILREVSDKDQFVEHCLRLDNLPAVPPYWPRMRGRNAEGVEPVGTVDLPPPVNVDDVDLDGDVIVLDTRQPEAYASGHIPGALNVGYGSSFPTWAGTVLPEGARTLVVVDDTDQLEEITWDLLRIGYDRPVGHLRGGMFSWRTAGRPMASLPTVTVQDLADDLDRYHVLDVRQPGEWADGHAPGAQFITGAELPSRIDEVPADRDVLVVCGSGFRSTVASALLRHHGRDNITNLLGGMSAWNAADLPTTSDDA